MLDYPTKITFSSASATKIIIKSEEAPAFQAGVSLTWFTLPRSRGDRFTQPYYPCGGWEAERKTIDSKGKN
jgi:hypothetical protein